MARTSMAVLDPVPVKTRRSKPDNGAYRTMGINFHRLSSLVKEKLGCDDGKIAVTFGEYVDFLLEHIKTPYEVISPKPEVDLMWHLHILDTKEYIRFCTDFFGHYFHHTPFVGDEKRPEPTRAKCGGCESGGKCFGSDPDIPHRLQFSGSSLF